ncbi:InlB B-repeat-containing protein [Pseudoflavonifractor capillosus]|uniref:InlB B-repeat-containing protein n=1 Tax=Pseudoflavonifractor capillosus TaxID=106588 RepID=A0A921MPA0_9FIRM|nr:InlB B-repeat-containing protein [Pseudoflavonifractor capillosus]HJG87586.1 InlB B-repeat-containing protein [Pseudoflavonifractor capillosus]
MKKSARKSISLLLAICMILSLCMPMSAGAASAAKPGTVDDKDPAVVFTDAGDYKWEVWEHLTFVRVAPLPVPELEAYPSVSVTFEGTGIRMFGQKVPNGPIFTVQIDGEDMGEADFYGTSKETELVYEKTGLENSVHTAVFTFTARTNSPDPGADLQPAVDYFEVIGQEEEHTVTVTGGTADPASALPGAEITVTADTPAEGKRFSGWTSEPAVEFENAAAAETTFVMPNADVTVTANYSDIAAISVEYWTTNSYVNPFQDFTKETTPMAGEAIEVLMARNDRESAQILLRSDVGFTITGVTFSDLSGDSGTIPAEDLKYNFVDYHYMSNSAGQNSSTTIRWGADYYPDRLSNDTERNVEAGKTQSVWLTVYAAPETAAGVYSGTATVNTDVGDFTVPVTAEVVDVEIPSPSEAHFDLAYWQNISGTWNWSGINPDRYIITGIFPEIKEAGKWSDAWWKYVESAADVMEEARINVLHVQPLELLMDGGSYVENYDEEGNAVYHFDWSKFDEYIQYFLDRGFIKKLELYHLLNTRYASHTEPTILIPNPDYDEEAGFSYTNRPLMIEEVSQYFADYSVPSGEREMAPRVEAFYDQYITALDEHLKEKGWLEMTYQHVEDECISTREQEEYLHMAEFYAERTTIPYGDPIDTNNVDFMMENTPLQFPLSSIYDGSRDKYQDWLAEHPDTVMMYTCLNPQGNNLNKFIDKPVWQMRIQTWYSYGQDVTGHLHWAWDAGWSDASKTDAAGVDRIKDINEFNYKGDDFVVWPDVERGGVASSIRAASIRDGAEDYEVFYALSQKGGDYDAWLKEQIGTIVRSNSSYTTDIETMMETREQIYRVAAGQEDIHCQATFRGNGGTPEETPVEVITGAPLGDRLPEAPTRAGYLFTGWNTKADGTGEEVTAETVVSADTAFYAQWISGNDILSFTVGGVAGVIDAEAHTVTLQLAHGTDLSALTPGLTLSAGASSAPASGEAADFSAGPVTYTVTAGDGTAQNWTVTITASDGGSDRTVTFEENGGEPALEDLTVPDGALLAEPEHEMTLERKHFEGWYRDKTLETPWDFTRDTVTENITLYAKWVDEYYYNDFAAETGTWERYSGAEYDKAVLVDDEQALDGKAVYLPSVAQSHQAIFLKEAGQLVNGTIEMRVKVTGIDGDPTLGISFRNLAKESYNAVSFKGGRHNDTLLTDTKPGIDSSTWLDPWTDATHPIEDGKYYTIQLRFYEQAITITVDGKEIVSGDTSWPEWSTKAGYVGIYGWGTTSNYTIDYIKVTPAREPAQYTVTLDTQDGGEPTVLTAGEGGLIEKPEDPVRQGYVFQGWYRDAAGAEAWDFESDRVYANVTLYAVWDALSTGTDITSFVLQGYEDYPGVIDSENHTVSVILPTGSELYLTPVIGLSEGASVRPASGLAVTFEDGQPYTYTVTAENGDAQEWAVTVTVLPEDSHQVIWHADGGTPVPTQTTVTEDGAIEAPAAMTRPGYTFGGWYLDPEFQTEAQFPITGMTADIHLYARWTGDAQAAFVFMSDTHVTGAGDSARLNYAFGYIDKLLPDGYDGLILAGDLVSDGAGDSQMQYVQQILDGYNPEGAAKYVVRGNHDPVSAMDTLSEELYPSSYYHVELSGYHFLMCDSNNFDGTQQNWLSGELAQIAASEDYDAGEPIFVVMHAPLSGTVLGSSASFSSSGAVYNILKDYPQAVVLTGHSHRDLYDDRAIHQKDFTSVHLGGMQYIEFDGGHIEGDVPAQTGLVHADGSQSQMNQAVIATVYSDRITFDRYDFSVDRHLGTWEVALPLTQESFTYTEDSRDAEAPVFPEDAQVSYNMISSSEVEFTYPQAEDNAYVYDYWIELKQSGSVVDTCLTLSQFYAAEVPARKTNHFAGLEPDTEYTLEITARDAVGNACAEKLTATFTTTATGALGSVSCADPTFDLDNAKDVTVDVTGENVTLHSVRFGDTALTPGVDYTVAGEQAVISKDYLKQFGPGATVTLDFVFTQGDPSELAIEVTGSNHIVKTAQRDFEDGDLSGFETYRQNYTIAINTESPLEGEKSLQVTTGNNGKQMLLDTNVPMVKDGILEFDVRPTGADFGAMAFIIRGTDDNNHLALGCDGTGDWLWINMSGGAETYALVANDSVPLLAGQTYHIRISFYGDNYEVYVDDTCVIRTVAPGLTNQAGYVGIHNWGSNTRGVMIDDVKLTYAVEKETPPTVPVTGVTLDKGSVSLKVGESDTLTATVQPDNATNKAVTWSSDNAAVATVADGVITAVSAGTATITVTTADGGCTDTCTVTVTDEPEIDEPTVPVTYHKIAIAATENGTVAASRRNAAKGTTVTLTVKADEGYELKSLTVTDASGNEVALSASNSFKMPDADVTVTAVFAKKGGETGEPSPSEGYTDLDTNAWYREAVDFVLEKGLMKGTSPTIFDPAGTTSRAMIFTILARLDGQATEGGATWYEKGMQWAVAEGVSDGTNPNASITREQLATMLYRYAGSPAVENVTLSFSDADQVSAWARTAVEWAVSKGILTGKGGNVLDPAGTATRAEVAAMLQRFVSLA